MESKRTRNILVSCGVIALISCVCLGLILVSGAGVAVVWPFNFTQDQESTPTIVEETETTQTPTRPSETDDDLPGLDQSQPEVSEPLPEVIAEIVLEIEAQVSQIRGLTLREPVPRVLMSPEKLKEIVVNEFFAEYTDEDARQDVLVLSLLGLLPADFDLKNFYYDLYSEQISGFYDSETEEIYIVKGTDFGGSEKLTYAHETTHVLQDQTYRFDEGLNYNEDACEVDSERCAAIQALIEGDASLTEIQWFQTYATLEDYQDLMQTFEEYTSPVFDTAPPYIQLDLYFPYETGFAFVEYLYDEGGYDAIDAAFGNLPLSTEQILHPERYPGDQPLPVSLPNLESLLGEAWSLFDQNVMGEWYTYLILSQSYNDAYRISDEQAQVAAEGWGGDAYAFYLNETTDEVIFILDMVWDSIVDADEFTVALAEYASLRWEYVGQRISGNPTWVGPEGSVVVMQDGERTVWIVAPTDALAETVLDSLR